MSVDGPLAPLVGRRVTGARLRAGSHLMVDLDAGFLWIGDAAWRITHGAQGLAANEDDHDRIRSAAGRLVGGLVDAAVVDEPLLDLRLAVGPVTVTVFPCASATDPDNYDVLHWAAWTPDDRIVTATVGGLRILPGSDPTMAARRAFMETRTG